MFEVLERSHEVKSIPVRPHPVYKDSQRHQHVLQMNHKRRRLQHSPESDEKMVDEDNKLTEVEKNGQVFQDTDDVKDEKGKQDEEEAKIMTKPRAEVRGHTSYLTFATLLPQFENK